MNMVCLSICLCHLQLLSSISYSFMSIVLLPSQVGLFLFTLFDVMVSDTVSLISFLIVCSYCTEMQQISVYQFCVLKFQRCPGSFLVVSLGFSMYSFMCSPNSVSFTSSFPIWIIFIFFPSLTAMARTSNTILNKSGEGGHACLIPDLRGNTFSFSLLSMILVMGLSYMAFIVLRYVSLYTHFLERFLKYKQILNFYQRLFLNLLR